MEASIFTQAGDHPNLIRFFGIGSKPANAGDCALHLACNRQSPPCTQHVTKPLSANVPRGPVGAAQEFLVCTRAKFSSLDNVLLDASEGPQVCSP